MRRFALTGWIVPGVFAGGAVIIGAHAAGLVDHAVVDGGMRGWLVALYGGLRAAVGAAFAIFTIGRAAPRRPSRDPVAFLACAVAMGSALAFGDPPARISDASVLLGDLVTFAACTWLLFAVSFLGRCFGVLPEARGLVRQGPYRVVRHPVYLGEIGASVGFAIAAPSALDLVMLAVLVGAQLVRMNLEEAALRDAFPASYDNYAKQVPRIVPWAPGGLRKTTHLLRAALTAPAGRN
jgi:protein-S-isoprenylcysteine O-methyltransferase Ste14